MYPAPTPPPRAHLWWLPPLITTVLLIPGSIVLISLLGISAMALASCGADGCPRAEAYRGVGRAMLGAGLLPVVVGWLLPRRPTFTPARWTMLALYVVLFLVGAIALINTPMGV
ncbi:hypothetical protein J4H86_15955 [Spiractinospora alimapuensis]|uniref:hypothetical protein n=1 Tax=Spiractinospora alimapuensis TaxID=2820884 RepID=UPI001F174514|nr:hypothetical protein [Spiractinospora alimapuensis]QVQ50418.1 hypothetical protein J4H86_15955 [Spiractinospora alimapuensis]